MEQLSEVETISLSAKIDLPRKSGHVEGAQALLEQAKKDKVGNRHLEDCKNDKANVYPKGIEFLIGAGAQIGSLNRLSLGQTYIHLVKYEGHLFTSFSEKPYAFSIDPGLKF